MIQAAAGIFETSEVAGVRSFNRTGARIQRVLSALKTTVVLLRSEQEAVCIVSSHIVTNSRWIYHAIQQCARRKLGLPPDRVLVFCGHNHCSFQLTDGPPAAGYGEERGSARTRLTPPGRRFFAGLEQVLQTLRGELQPVTVSWAVGREGRISYNRKGRRADGTTYLMREEDRLLLGRDFRGDIDEEAPVVCLRARHGQPVAVFAQFNAHPATAYHPEHPIVHGEYPQTACDLVSRKLSRSHETVPVAFFQGCAGDINAKGLLSGDVRRTERFGRLLGNTYLRACRHPQPSRSDRLALRRSVVRVPLQPLPSLRRLLQEKEEIAAFLRRARKGDEDTMSCLGLNFPRQLTPPYRAALMEPVWDWNRWAIRMRRSHGTALVPRFVEMEICVLRLGDVAIVGMPCEPFVGIGRRIRRDSPAPLTIPCGYTNTSRGYVPDGPNVGDREYMSSFYRYTRHPDYRRPAGDVLARQAIRLLNALFARPRP